MTDPAAPPDVDCEQEHAELFVSDSYRFVER